VEDDPNDIFLFSRAFKKSGMQAELKAIEDGETLIQFLTSLLEGSEARLPSVLLLDIKLPKQSGFEVLQWLRSHATFRYLPVVMLTSSAQPPDVRRAYELGANGYLVKPMEVDNFISLLNGVEQFWLNANVNPLVNRPVTAPAAVA